MDQRMLYHRADRRDGGMNMDVRLKTVPYEIDGTKLMLCCSMNVLADLQEQGDLSQLLESSRTMRSYLQLLAAMINNAMREAGSEQRYTDVELGDRISFRDFRRDSGSVFDLLISAVRDDTSEQTDAPQPEHPGADEKNAVTSKDDGTASTLPGT